MFRERKGGRERERERNIDRLPLSCPPLGTWPTTQACQAPEPQAHCPICPLFSQLDLHPTKAALYKVLSSTFWGHLPGLHSGDQSWGLKGRQPDRCRDIAQKVPQNGGPPMAGVGAGRTVERGPWGGTARLSKQNHSRPAVLF